MLLLKGLAKLKLSVRNPVVFKFVFFFFFLTLLPSLKYLSE